jgi:hypothetical protein
MFAHVPGGRAVRSGTEPLFLWVRLVVSDIVEEIWPGGNLFAEVAW